jgi:hypothetical protein
MKDYYFSPARAAMEEYDRARSAGRRAVAGGYRPKRAAHRPESAERRLDIARWAIIGTMAVSLMTTVSGKNCNGERRPPLPIAADFVRQSMYRLNGQGASVQDTVEFLGYPVHEQKGSVWSYDGSKCIRTAQAIQEVQATP